MRAACLFLVFALAKIAILWGRDLPLPVAAPLAYLWQDAAVALAFLAFERITRSPWAARAAYGALVLLAAITVPVARVLSSPLTVPMLRATRGTLADSIAHHATIGNLFGVAVVLAAGAFAPMALRRMPGLTACGGPPKPWRRRKTPAATALGAAALALTCAGALVAPRIDTAGLERNPLLALIRTAVPRVSAEPRDGEWRESPFGSSAREDLSALRAAATGQNVLLVVLESTAARYLRAYGASDDPTPNLTALARRSIVFESAYAVYPESVKGLVALLASRYPGFDVPAERHARIVAPSLATALGDAGYETALFHSGRFMYLGMDALVANAGFARAEDAGDIGGHRESSFGIEEAAAVRRILTWIDARPRGRPFFAAYLPIAGHHPYASAPGPFPAGDDIGRYRNALFESDRALGELIDGLRARGLDRSTLILVAGDHGEAFGQHAGNYGHTLALFEENIRVPLVMAVPGAPVRPARVRRTASVMDVAPTVLDVVGLDRPPTFQGHSLLDPDERMALFFTDYSLGLLGLRDGCFKYIDELESGRAKLFDVCRDPDERVDLAPREPDRARSYRTRLREWSAAEVARVDHAARQ